MEHPDHVLYYCINCGVRFAGNPERCPVCNNPAPSWGRVKTCRGCGRQVPADARFCCFDGGRLENCMYPDHGDAKPGSFENGKNVTGPL